MDCARAQILCSASLDGELDPSEQRHLDEHLASCPACRRFAADATALHRVVRIAPAEPVPDLTATILAATAPAPVTELPSRTRVLRLALVAIALVEILLSVPGLFDAEHTQHLAAFDLALAVGFLWVAARPQRTLSGFLPIGTALVLLCVGLSLADAAQGDGESARVVTHSIAVVGMIVAWTLEAQLHHLPEGPAAKDTSLAA
jgi:predicted anti-sigma-YlaC factor YlaD